MNVFWHVEIAQGLNNSLKCEVVWLLIFMINYLAMVSFWHKDLTSVYTIDGVYFLATYNSLFHYQYFLFNTFC